SAYGPYSSAGESRQTEPAHAISLYEARTRQTGVRNGITGDGHRPAYARSRRWLRSASRVAGGAAADGWPLCVLRSFRAHDLARRHGTRCPAASPYRLGDRDL